jgi:hypothetical protein
VVTVVGRPGGVRVGRGLLDGDRGVDAALTGGVREHAGQQSRDQTGQQAAQQDGTVGGGGAGRAQ